MPELPEVETIASVLAHGREDSPSLLHRKVTGAQLFWERSLAAPAPDEFKSRIVGQVVEEVGRRGKFLIVHLSTDTLLIHLRMSGDIRVEPDSLPISPYDRLILLFKEDSLRLAFNDTRKFGRVWLTADPQQVLGNLGPEPLDGNLTPKDFYRMLQSRRRLLKPLLLDQTFLAGLGNIYTDEALHLAHLHPLAVSDQLSFEQAERLWDSIQQVLREGIRRQGASIDWVYRGGDFQNYFRAYGRKGEPCPECGTPIRRIQVGQRSTHFCPECQKV